MQEFGPEGLTTLLVPRGTIGRDPLHLDMVAIYEAERRVVELKVVNPMTATELKTTFNQAANTLGKYLAWIEYEMLECEKNQKLEKARITLDESIEAFKKFKEVGMKYNEDFREALCIRDHAWRDLEDRKIMMTAAKALLKVKFDTFIRSYYSAQDKEDRKSGAVGIAASQRINAMPGALSLDPADWRGVPGRNGG